MSYYTVHQNQLVVTSNPPDGAVPFVEGVKTLLPPLVTNLHESLRQWNGVARTPGPVTPERIWFDGAGTLSFRFGAKYKPLPLTQVGLAPALAAWLVLLDHYMETFVVVARARAVWSVDELAAALPFVTPGYLPPKLLRHTNGSWSRTAHAVAAAVADGALAGAPQDRHWKESF